MTFGGRCFPRLCCAHCSILTTISLDTLYSGACWLVTLICVAIFTLLICLVLRTAWSTSLVLYCVNFVKNVSRHVAHDNSVCESLAGGRCCFQCELSFIFVQFIVTTLEVCSSGFLCVAGSICFSDTCFTSGFFVRGTFPTTIITCRYPCVLNKRRPGMKDLG